MPRIRRITAVEIPHHITQRGNYRQTVFKSSSDRERYVERNPVRSGLIKKPWEWKWSSAIEHTENIDKNKSILKLSEITKYIEMNKEEWKNFLNEKEDKEKIGTIKKHTL